MSRPSSAQPGPGGTSGGTSGGAPGGTSGDTSSVTAGVAPGDTSGGASGDTSGRASGGTSSSRRGTWIFIATIAAVLALDQLTKLLVRQRLPVGTSWPTSDTLIGRFFSFTHVQNTGVSFGMFQGHNDVMVLVALAVVGGVLIYRWHLGRTDTWINVATGLIIGGALGNLVDRLYIGHVVDFLDFQIWPVFNVADTSVFVGVVLLTVHIWLEERERQQIESASGGAAGGEAGGSADGTSSGAVGDTAADTSAAADITKATEEPGD